jgi:inner membrane protein involved in colicin E2 resistance
MFSFFLDHTSHKKIMGFVFSISLSASSFVMAQEGKVDKAFNVKKYNVKINDYLEVRTKAGFELERKIKLHARSGFDLELNFPLRRQQLYSLVFVGDPSSSRIITNLSHPQLGDIFVDRIKTGRDKDFFTEFQFSCELSGTYRLTVLQKNKYIDNPLGYFMLFRRVK